MTRPIDSGSGVLARITPVLPAVLHAYRVPVPVAKEIVDKACWTLIAKRRMLLEDPESWLLRTIIESCRRWRKEIQFEDPSE
jgi:hypothetical protein